MNTNNYEPVRTRELLYIYPIVLIKLALCLTFYIKNNVLKKTEEGNIIRGLLYKLMSSGFGKLGFPAHNISADNIVENRVSVCHVKKKRLNV